MLIFLSQVFQFEFQALLLVEEHIIINLGGLEEFAVDHVSNTHGGAEH
jgi:hypothetical protein